MKIAFLAVCALSAIFIAPSVQARDDGGFGPVHMRVSSALGDNTADLIARGEISASDIANIAPAAGDEKTPTTGQPQEPKLSAPSLIKNDTKKPTAK